MSKKYQNGFFIFGIAVLAIMVAQLNFAEVCTAVSHAGYWFAAVLALWALLYIFNTAAWYVIIQAGGRVKVPRAWLYKITVSGFALNYATPGGLMGGEPYRIMSLSPLIGTERASSSVILYVMTHIFSHFWFWLLSIMLFVVWGRHTGATVSVAAASTLFCLAGLWFFMVGYKKGIALRLATWLSHLPWVGKRVRAFADSHHEQLLTIDHQVAALHHQNKRTLVTAVVLELLCRVCSAAEIYFTILVLTPHITYVQCILILAFTSLFANILFFIPLQLGGREGGFLMSAAGLGMTASTGIFVALIVRLRELVWTGIGLLLIKCERQHPNTPATSSTSSSAASSTPPSSTSSSTTTSH